jgi:hypothetical protein
MKILVQNVLDLQFACEDGTWTRDAGRAKDYRQIDKAIEYVASFPDARIVIKFAESNKDWYLPSLEAVGLQNDAGSNLGARGFRL